MILKRLVEIGGTPNTTRRKIWLSPTERASVSAISLRHNFATSGESRRYVVAFTRFADGGIWLHQESLTHFGLPWVRPWDSRGKCYTGRKRIQCWSTHSSIYLFIFNHLRAIVRYWSEIATVSYPLAFNASVGVFPFEFREKFGPQKTRIMGLTGSEDTLTIVWAASIQYTSVWRTDGQTSSLYSYNVRQSSDVH